jgi:DNA-binding MarR family transcriptional regulator
MLKKNRTEYLQKLMPALSTLYRCMATSRDGFLAQFNLSRPQLEVLTALQERPYTTSVLAKEFSVSPSAVSQMVDQLIDKKLVERIEDTTDRRITNIQLSSGGTQLFEEINEKFLEHLEEKFSLVSIKEIEVLLTTIAKITRDVAKD